MSTPLGGGLVLGPWTALPDATGDALAVAGALAAAASSTRAVVWDGDRVVADVELPGGPAGIPRFVDRSLHYGTGWIEGGAWKALPAPTVHGALRTSAWSRDGRRVVLLADGPWRPPGGAGPASLLVERRLDGETRILAADPGSEAVWVFEDRIAGVGRELKVWDASGLRLTLPAHVAGIASVSGSDDDAWLLTVGTDGTALLWEAGAFGSPTAWPGTWRAAALAPDGRWAAAIDISGTVHGARRAGAALVPVGPLPATGVRALALDDLRILVSFNEAPFHRKAEVALAGVAP